MTEVYFCLAFTFASALVDLHGVYESVEYIGRFLPSITMPLRDPIKSHEYILSFLQTMFPSKRFDTLYPDILVLTLCDY